MPEFAASIFVHQRTLMQVRYACAGPVQTTRPILPIAVNDNNRCGIALTSITPYIRMLLDHHGIQAARHVGTLAQSAFWRGDMDAYRTHIAAQGQLNLIIAAQPIAPSSYNIWEISR